MEQWKTGQAQQFIRICSITEKHQSALIQNYILINNFRVSRVPSKFSKIE